MDAAAMAVKWRPQMARVKSKAGRHGSSWGLRRCSARAAALSAIPSRSETETIVWSQAKRPGSFTAAIPI